MRVARLLEKLPPEPGGKEIHAAELSRALADLGVEQHVFARVGDAVDPRVEMSKLGPRFAAENDRTLVAFAAWATARALVAHAAQPFDAVHAHGDFVEATAAAAVARACGVPAFLTVHADFGAVRWQNAWRRATFRRMSTIWAVSEAAAESVRQAAIDVPTVVRSSAVRDEFFDVRADERDGGIVFVGRLNPLKGLEHMIAAYDLVGEELGLPWKVFGGGSGEYATRIVDAIAARPLMEWRQERDPGRLALELARATAFVLPSVDLGTLREGVPTALLEAIATKTPIVATSTAGLARLLDHGRAGLLIEPENPRALADAVAATVRDPESARARAEYALRMGHVRRWRDLAAEVGQRYAEVATERAS